MPELGALADRVAVLPADLPVGELEAMIRADPASLGVIADDGGTLHVLDRPYLETVFAGRLGYGGAVLHRRPTRAVLRRPALVLPAATEWDDAARRCLDRPNRDQATPVVVRLDDGGYGLAPVGPLGGLEAFRLGGDEFVVLIDDPGDLLAGADVAMAAAKRDRTGVEVWGPELAGHGPLALLTELPLDELKLDRSFLERIDEPPSRAIVDAVARMAKGLRLTLVAEGVEDRRTAEMLAAAGFDLLQGYHFGRPMPADRVPPAVAV
ncbi:EAL domain-containing protein [Actinoplanes sp. NPDC051411]|uniref:EAL domain-containing protein n=1 Tax=Actinoplanes sp. NPDC051411 TaxID=3155522 RepID=UPI00343B6911